MGSSSQEDEAAQALGHGGGFRKMGGGSSSRSRKKMAKAVSRKYAFVAGTCVPSGARAYWASRPAGPGWWARLLGPAGRPRPGGVVVGPAEG